MKWHIDAWGMNRETWEEIQVTDVLAQLWNELEDELFKAYSLHLDLYQVMERLEETAYSEVILFLSMTDNWLVVDMTETMWCSSYRRPITQQSIT